jgi:hypothetical protein
MNIGDEAPAGDERAREGECELGTLAIGKTVSGTDFGVAESALNTLYVARNRG